METFELLFVAPIPTGHRVELTWYGEPITSGGFSSKVTRGGPPDRSKPVVRDVETGVVYGPLDLFLEQRTGYSTDAVRPIAAEPLPQLGVAGRVTGRVVACRVLTEKNASEVGIIQTSLVVELDPQDGTPYR